MAREHVDTRAVLIAAAIDTLREAGFAGASARRIAKRAGCNQALIFYHFGSVPGKALPHRADGEGAAALGRGVMRRRTRGGRRPRRTARRPRRPRSPARRARA